MLLFKRLICAPHCVLHSFIFIFSFFIFHFFGRAPRRKRLRVGLSALTRRIPADVCALPTRFPRFILNFSFFILFCVSYPLLSLTHPNAHAYPVPTIHDQQCGANCLINIRAITLYGAITRIAPTLLCFAQTLTKRFNAYTLHKNLHF